MNIGLTCHATLGGSAVIATELGLALASRGHQVHFICASAPPRFHAQPNVTLHLVESPTYPLFPHGEFTLALASKLLEVSRVHRLQCLHVHYAIPLATSAQLARDIMGAQAPRLVTTVHGTDVLTLGQEAQFKPLVQHALAHSDAVTAPSQFLASAAAQQFSLSPQQVRVISNFVDTQRFQPGPRQIDRFGFSSRLSKVITHNSNFRSLKRVQDVVQIFHRVRQTVDCGLALIGEGPERPAVERLVESLGLTDSVRFLGEQRDFLWVLQSSDVFLLPSAVESFGLAALEAMAVGVPVVGSATGGIPEAVLDNHTGFLHPVGDVDAMAASTRRLLEDQTLHARLSHAAREWCLSRWQPGPIVDAWEELYQHLL